MPTAMLRAAEAGPRAGGRSASSPWSRQSTPQEDAARARPRAWLDPIEALAIGSSTGGPQALLQLFAALSSPFTCPVFVTQHMPPTFTAMLAEQIDRLAVLSLPQGPRRRAGHRRANLRGAG